MFVASWFVAAIGWGPMVHETVETEKPPREAHSVCGEACREGVTQSLLKEKKLLLSTRKLKPFKEVSTWPAALKLKQTCQFI